MAPADADPDRKAHHGPGASASNRMPTYECSACGETAVERSYNVSFLEVTCPECGAFCPHVNMDHPEIRQVIERLDVEPSAAALVDAIRDVQ